ncbi:MAG: hypothetical protein M5U14_00350 [Acidimicrobiia bacterium]|nr:hypothetical protein [Acidimicrobiia bacterium]
MIDAVEELEPVEMPCLRCGEPALMRFAGPCRRCVGELHERFAPHERHVEVEAFEPRMHVTPNAVALKDD